MSLFPRWFPILTLLLLHAAPAGAARVTLLFEADNGASASGGYYVSMNWDPESGRYNAGWNDFSRFPMYDDGRHGDGDAGDNLWGFTSELLPSRERSFEWAVDNDPDPNNGWIGTGTKFIVQSDEDLVVRFRELREEERASLADLEALAGVRLGEGHAPVPVRDGDAFLFVVRAPEAERVYLAGTFNNWADNSNGVVSNPQYRMFRKAGGNWVRIIESWPTVIRYKYVIVNEPGSFEWIPDPHAEGRDAHGNTVLDLRTLFPDRFITSVSGRPLQPAAIPQSRALRSGETLLRVYPAKAWVRPGETHRIVFEAPPEAAGERTEIRLVPHSEFQAAEAITLPVKNGRVELEPPAGSVEAPLVLSATLLVEGNELDHQVVVLPVLDDPVHDLRYGFYANWNRVADNYGAKARMLSELLINAVEFYDYFPAHGKYAPDEEVYELEPFAGKKIYARDIQGKIDAGHEYDILAIAYVAAYAASESIYEKYPYPMTDAEGNILHFNGAVKTLDEVMREGERVWFWLMAIAPDTPWHDYILGELRDALADNPGDFVAFDGFEVDSYGHSQDERYYSHGSAHSGRLLADVVADFIADVHELAHETKDYAAVSFNCVNEFGITRMYDITDFIFIENWSGYKPGIEETIDICYRHRAPRRQRVILKMYPADAGFSDPPLFPPNNLRLMLGMCITGGGSLMIAGEPDERTREMHALNSLYYPDNVPLPREQLDIVRAYNRFDAMLFGYNHGARVHNYETSLYLPGVAVRGFQNERGDITVMMLNHGDTTAWNTGRGDVQPLENVEIAINVPSDGDFEAVHYASPDSPPLQLPIPLDFERNGDFIRTLIPRLHTTGAVVLRQSSN